MSIHYKKIYYGFIYHEAVRQSGLSTGMSSISPSLTCAKRLLTACFADADNMAY